MTLPEFDIDEIPGLETKTGTYGSSITGGGSSDDRVIAVMVYIYNTASAEGVSDL